MGGRRFFRAAADWAAGAAAGAAGFARRAAGHGYELIRKLEERSGGFYTQARAWILSGTDLS